MITIRRPSLRMYRTNQQERLCRARKLSLRDAYRRIPDYCKWRTIKHTAIEHTVIKVDPWSEIAARELTVSASWAIAFDAYRGVER